jgi:hypothetical protein
VRNAGTNGLWGGFNPTMDISKISVTATLSMPTGGAAMAVVTFSNLSQTYDGTARSVTASTTPSSLNVLLTYNGSANAPTNVGSYTVIGTVNDSNYTGSATNTLTVSQATATVNLSNLSQTYDGTARVVSASTTPSGLNVLLTYNGSANAPTNVGSYTVIGTVSDANYVGGATNTLVVGPSLATPTLVSEVIGNQLQLSWPPDHLGWRLQIQTNDLSRGISTNWAMVPNSTNVMAANIVINPTNGSVFLRLVYP